ncbi:hypothetical protein VTN00DRAFT_5815 [Thermoascus crustaceus]|uniref:uncharacterized protein n=1 Tax=Thermoascus crustaceus TaxID=5088 RepID=UPI0037431571
MHSTPDLGIVFSILDYSKLGSGNSSGSRSSNVLYGVVVRKSKQNRQAGGRQAKKKPDGRQTDGANSTRSIRVNKIMPKNKTKQQQQSESFNRIKSISSVQFSSDQSVSLHQRTRNDRQRKIAK